MKKLIPLLMVALAALSIAAIYLFQELRDVRAQTSELTAHVSDLQAAGLKAAASPVTSGSTAETQAVAAATIPGAAPTLPAAATAEKKTTSGLQELAQQMLGTPEGQEMIKAQLRMLLPQQFPDLGKEVGLTAAETEKLFDLLAKQQMAATTGGLDILAGNGTSDRAAMEETRRKIQEQQRATQAEVATLLGDKLPKYQEYQKTLPMRQQVTQLRSNLGTGNNALSDAQTKPLINALAAEQERIQQERRTAPRPPQQQGQTNPQTGIEQQFERAAEDNRRLVSTASAYLNPQQLNSYRQQLEQQLNLQRTLIRGISSQTGNQGAANGQPARPNTPN